MTTPEAGLSAFVKAGRPRRSKNIAEGILLEVRTGRLVQTTDKIS
jgi:hypothetical protein